VNWTEPGAAVHVTARLLPGGDLVLIEIGGDDGPHWVVSTDDARSVGWSLIDAANGHGLLSGVTMTDRHARPDVDRLLEQWRAER